MKNLKKTISVIISYALVISMLFSSLSVNALAATEEYTELELGVAADVTINEADGEVIYKFVPEEDGEYVIYSSGNYDTIGYLLEERLTNNLEYNDDYNDSNFAIFYELTAGTTYYIRTKFWRSSMTGTYSVTVDKVVAATNVVIENGETVIEEYEGRRCDLTLKFEPTYCKEEEVTWESSNTDIATVNDNGTVICVSEGTATITVTSTNGLQDDIQVVVKDIPEIEFGVENAITLDANESAYFKFVPAETGTYKFYSEGAEHLATCFLYDWEWHNLATGYDNDNGDVVLTCNLTGGETYYLLLANNNSWTKNFTLMIKQLTEVATNLTIVDGEEISGFPRESYQLTTAFAPEDCIPETITWESADTSVATVDNYGYVNFIATGETTITATSANGLTASVRVVVKEIPALEAGVKTDVTVEESDEYVRTYYKFTPEHDGAYKFYSIGLNNYNVICHLMDSNWSTLISDYNSAGGNGNFSVTYNLTGGQTYYLSVDGWFYRTQSFQMEVKELTEPAISMTITQGTEISGYSGKSKEVTIEFSPEDCIPQTVSWRTSDKTVANVTADGNGTSAMIRFYMAGTATITATTTEGLRAELTVTVKAIPALELNVETETIVEGDGIALYRFTPTEAGAYKFYSNNANNNFNCILCDSTNNSLISDYNSSGENGNFAVSYNLEAGRTYYLEVRNRTMIQRTCGVAVKQLTEPATGIVIDGDTEINGYVGEERWLEANFVPEDCIPEEITWTTSDSSVVRIPESYKGEEVWIQYVASGTAIITATTTSGLTASVTVTVNEIPQLELNVEATTVIEIDGSVRYQFTPETDGAYKFYSVKGDYNLYANLYDSNNHYLMGGNSNSDGYGNFVISYNLEGGETYYIQVHNQSMWEMTCGIAVKELTEPATSITFDRGRKISGYVGNEEHISVQFAPTDCIPQNVTWTSDNHSIATVSPNNSDGKEAWIYFVSAGTTTITATTEKGLTATITVTVKEMQTLTLNVETPATIQGDEEVYYQFTPEKDGAYKFYSINGNYNLNASLFHSKYGWLEDDYNDSGEDGNFAISYNLEGGETYIISVETRHLEEITYSIGVKELTEPATSIVIEGDAEISGYVGEREYLTAYLLPLDCIPQDIEWKTSDASVAELSVSSRMKNAWVYFVGTGTATITAKTETGLVATITVTVKEIEEIKVGEQSSFVFTGEGMDESHYLKFVPEESGTYKFSVDGKYVNISLYNEHFNHIIGGQNNVLIYALEAGETYHFGINSWNEGTFIATIEETLGVSSIEIVSYPERMEYYKDADNYFDMAGIQLKVTFEDGSIANWEYGDGDLNGYTVSWSGYYEESTQSGTRYVITCGGKSVEFSFVLIDNPVESIRLYSGEIPELIENVDGWENWNEIFIYETAWARALQFEIVYLDGTTKIVSMFDVVDGYTISYENNQWETPWSLGDDNYLTVKYAGRTVDLQVTIVENPVEEIVLNSAPSKQYIWGDYAFGEVYDGIYYLYPTDLTGLSFTVKFKDGTSKTFTYADIDEDGFCDGYEVVIYEIMCEEAGSVEATLSYMGHKFEYNVTVKETGVSSIEVIKDPNVTEYVYWYEPDFAGMQVKITYTDGTSEVVEFTEENLQYYIYSQMYCSVGTDDSLIAVIYEYETETYRIVFQGVECEYDGITHTEGKEISSVEVDNVSVELVGMKVKVTYADGTVNNFTILEVLDADVYEEGDEYSYIDAYVRTEAGIQYCSVEKYSDGYYVYIFDEGINIEKEEVVTIIGDVNNDGEVNNLDRQILTRYLANWEGYGEDALNLQAADVNGDGEVNNLDRQILTRHLANWEGYENLPYETNTDSDNTENEPTIEEDDDESWGPFF